MRILSPLFLASFAFLAGPILAADDDQLMGTPAVLPSGVIMLEGHDIGLWGIDMLTSDQQCWHEERAWDCGAQALTALRHHMAGHPLRCIVKADQEKSKVSAQCFRKLDGQENDVAGYLVQEGWARDNASISGGIYAEKEGEARANHRGIWTSRFQSAEDWKNGNPRYIEYVSPPPPSPNPGETEGNPHE